MFLELTQACLLGYSDDQKLQAPLCGILSFWESLE